MLFGRQRKHLVNLIKFNLLLDTFFLSLMLDADFHVKFYSAAPAALNEFLIARVTSAKHEKKKFRNVLQPIKLL